MSTTDTSWSHSERTVATATIGSSFSPHIPSAAPRQGARIFTTQTAMPAMLSGAVLAVMFNPYDRALYLRVHHRRPFFHSANWSAPFQGFANAAVYRTICSGSYLVWQDTARQAFTQYRSSTLVEGVSQPNTMLETMIIGLFAGTMNGFLLNHPQLVKYKMWSDGRGSFVSTTRELLQSGGPRLLLRGVRASVARDAVFGVVYEVARSSRPISQQSSSSALTQFATNVCAAGLASCLSSPLNYCRNVTYGTPNHSCPLRIRTLLRQMWLQCCRHPTWMSKCTFLNSRLNLCLGTARIGLGMGVGQGLFELFKSRMHPPSREQVSLPSQSQRLKH